MPTNDILSREKDLLKDVYQHEILVKGADFETSKAKVLKFFERYQLVRYSQIVVVQDASLASGSPGFAGRLQEATRKNREILHALMEEFLGEGIGTLQDLSGLPQGYKTKMLHVITHILDGFFGVDTYFYNLEEDSHWVSGPLLQRLVSDSSPHWLLKVEARI